MLPGKVGKYSYLLGVSLIIEFSVLLWMRDDVHLPWASAWTKVMMARQMKANSPRTKDGSTFTIMVVMIMI